MNQRFLNLQNSDSVSEGANLAFWGTIAQNLYTTSQQSMQEEKYHPTDA